MGTRMEVPPPCNFLMTRGGGGEVKTRQVEPGGDGGVRGGREFFFQQARRDWTHPILHLIWPPGDLFSEI